MKLSKDIFKHLEKQIAISLVEKVNLLPDNLVVTLAGDYIVSVDGKFILTTYGFISLT